MLDNDTGDLPGHDTWVPVDAAPIQVNVESLREYSILLSKEMTDDFNVNLKEGVTPMLRVQSTFGGMGEGKLYRGTHAKATMAVGLMLKDLSFCLSSLSQAAAAIYFEYIGGDDLSKAKVDDVYDVFYPTDGRQTIQGAAAEQTAQEDKGKQFTGSASTTDYLPDPSRPDQVASAEPTTFASWDDSFTVAEGTKGQYVVDGNQTDMINTPEDPMLKK
jgi:hypothetical protein